MRTNKRTVSHPSQSNEVVEFSMLDVQFRQYLDDSPVPIRPILAQAMGLNASIVFQQLHYWLEHNRQSENPLTYQEGRYWSFNSYRAWQKSNFTWWSVDTIKDAFKTLESLRLVLSANFNKWKVDRTKWYTIDYDAYMNFMQLWDSTGRPLAGDGRKSQEYMRFLEAWRDADNRFPMRASSPDEQGTNPKRQASSTHGGSYQTQPVPEDSTEDTSNTTQKNHKPEITPDGVFRGMPPSAGDLNEDSNAKACPMEKAAAATKSSKLHKSKRSELVRKLQSVLPYHKMSSSIERKLSQPILATKPDHEEDPEPSYWVSPVELYDTHKIYRDWIHFKVIPYFKKFNRDGSPDALDHLARLTMMYDTGGNSFFDYCDYRERTDHQHRADYEDLE